MSDKERLINQFSTFIPFVESLRELDDKAWITPIEEGKWTPRDVIAHMMLWDKYFLEEAISKITSNQALTVRHLNFQEFNEQAVQYAKTKSKQEIINLAVEYRNEILRHLKLLSEDGFMNEHKYGDGYNLSAYNYIIDFIDHDTHHINQLKKFFSKVQD